MTDLSMFVGQDVSSAQGAGESLRSLSVIVFTFDDSSYVLAADQAVAIIPMRPATRLPGAHSGFAGAIQDRGRVIALLAHPLAVAGSHSAAVRVIVCQAERGLLGIPVTTLAGLRELRVKGEPAHAGLISDDGNSFTFVDVRALSEICRHGAPGAGA
jgi:chemotaxis signal transduction protein